MPKDAVAKNLTHAQLIRLRCLELAISTRRPQETAAQVLERSDAYREYIETHKQPSKSAKASSKKSRR